MMAETASPARNAAYAACGAFIDELVGQGVQHAVVSPGSRSTALALTMQAHPCLTIWPRLDERSAGFFALGLAKATGKAVLLVCTSGTAATNYLPAVVEAHYSGVPLLVVTADRPPELQEWGAGQTIDQTHLYGSHVRWFADLPVASETAPSWSRTIAARAMGATGGHDPGPVHLNWAFREPLEPLAADLTGQPTNGTPSVEMLTSTPTPARDDIDRLIELANRTERGLVVAGPMLIAPPSLEAVVEFCARTGWPLLAEPSSQLRLRADNTVVTAHHDHLLRTAWAEQHVPDVVLRLGASPTCKPLRLWLERHRPSHVLLDPSRRWNEASFTASTVFSSGPELLAEALPGLSVRGTTTWNRAWSNAESRAREAITDIVESEPLMEAGLAREIGRHSPPDCALYVSNSMPVRDIDSFMEARSRPPLVFANRGASGIDGLISSAAGVAASGTPTILLTGDLAFYHDIGGLLAVTNTDIDLTIVVANNSGGGIFSFLPVAGSIGPDVVDTAFTTPQSHDIGALCAGAGVRHDLLTDSGSVKRALAERTTAVRVHELPVDRAASVDQHRRIVDAVASALT